MAFGNVALLLGMALGLIPIIIHLINRRRARLRQFAAIDFLLLSDKRVARRLRLKQLLVLALRVLLLVGLAFALSKPYIQPDNLEVAALSDPAGVVIIIDDSLSMQAVEGDERLLDRALSHAKKIVAAGGERTSFAVIAAGAPARLLTKGLTYDKAALDRALERLEVQARAGDLEGALAEAGRVLSESPEPRRVIYVLTDGAAHAWPAAASPWTYVPLSQLEIVDVREGRPIDNLAIAGVSVNRVDEGADARLVIEATVVNRAREPRGVNVELALGSRVTAEPLRVAPGATAVASFSVDPAAGVTRGVVSIAPNDALVVDDKWFFTLEQSDVLHVLVVNGGPRSEAHLDELFFVRAALRSDMVSGPQLNPVFSSIEELTPARVGPMDVVILANVGTLTAEQALTLRHFVEGGGGVFITAGDGFSEASNASFKQLLPYPVRGVKTVARADDPASALTALTIGTADFAHPVMEVFQGVQDASLFKARVYSYVLIDTVGAPGARVVASYAGGIPALVERRTGRGRVLFLTTTIDRDWSDLAMRSSFLPLVQRVVSYLGGGLALGGGGGHLVGQPLRVTAPEGRRPLVLDLPDGESVPFAEDAEDPDTGTVFIEAPAAVGHYRLRRGAPGSDALAVNVDGAPAEPGRRSPTARTVSFAVNADRAESDFSLASEDVRAAFATELTRDNGILPAGPVNEASIVTAGAGSSGRTLLWPYVLAGLFILFSAEAWLIVRG